MHPFPLLPRQARRRGFTLVEATLATALASLIFLGVIALFLNAARLTNRTNALMSASADSANAVQQVIEKTREANGILLPDDTGFKPVAGHAATANYETTLNGQKVNTAMQLNLPPQRTATANQDVLPAVSVFDAGGSSQPVTVYDRTDALKTGGVAYYDLFYRGDASRAPNPTSGKYLWKYDSAAGTTTALCKTIDANTANAVQFVQPQLAQTSVATTQVEVKIVSSSYSLINGQQTGERTDGTNTSSLTGKCVLMRDYNPNATQTASTDGQSLNRAFQKG